MKHLGDICKIKGSEVEKVDVITFGAPCQDISIAGARAGIKHSAHGDDETTRSGLFFEALRIIREMREDDEKHGRAIQFIRPRYAIYENVGGLTSSNNGRDFQKVLTEFVKIVEPDAPEIPMPEKGGWPHADAIYGVGANGEPFSIAWRLHDAAKWGVPQRRKRYCVLADFNGFSAAEILFDPQFERMPARGMSITSDRNLGANRRPEVQTQPEGLSGDSAEGGAAREGAAALAGYSAEAAISFQERAGKPGGGKGILIQRDRVGALSTFNNQSVLQIKDAIPIDTMNAIGRSNPDHTLGIGKDGDPQYTLSTNNCHAVCYGISAFDSNAMKSPNPHSGIYEASTARTLDLNGGSPACNQGGMAILCLNDQGGQNMDLSEDMTGTLRAQDHGHPPLIYDARGRGDGQTVPTMVGDHFGHASDFMAVCVEPQDKVYAATVGGFLSVTEDVVQTLMARDYKDPQIVCQPKNQQFYAQKKFGDLNADNVASTLTAHEALEDRDLIVSMDGGEKDAGTQYSILRILQEAYGAEKTIEWGTAVLDALQQAEILRQGMHESGVPSEATQGDELDDGSLPCAELAAEWLLRDMRKREKCGCASQGRQSAEQRTLELTEIMQKLPHESTQAAPLLLNLWQTGEGLWLLLQALHEIQKIRKSNDGKRQSIYGDSVVRRLTPLEAERLQGFPDNWTLIGEPEEITVKDYAMQYDAEGNEIGKKVIGTHTETAYFYTDEDGKKKQCVDSARYKALGNSIALPFWEWLARRICARYERPITMGSLFSGIGGFEFVFQKCGATPVWSSEIEQYPIAVTKKHFPE